MSTIVNINSIRIYNYSQQFNSWKEIGEKINLAAEKLVEKNASPKVIEWVQQLLLSLIENANTD